MHRTRAPSRSRDGDRRRCGRRLEAGWSDLGSWDAVWDAMEKDANRQRSERGRVVVRRRDVELRAFGRRAPCRVRRHDELVVVETDDAVLVADRSRVQDVKGLVSRIKRAARAGSRRASQGAPPVGLLRFDRSRRALPGEAHRGDAGRAAVAADASSPRRALDRRARHGARHARRRAVPAERERVDVTSRSACGTGSKTRARCRSKSSKCSRARISAKTTSCASTTTTAVAAAGNTRQA